jgi:DNA primase
LRTLDSANKYTVKNLMRRLKRKKDAWADIAKMRQRLPRLK